MTDKAGKPDSVGPNSILQNVVLWAGFQVVWLAAAFGAASGASTPAIAAAVVYLAAVLAVGHDLARTVQLALASAILGFAVETGLVAAQILSYEAAWPSSELAPAWIVALWLGFGATIPAIAALFGRDRWLRLVVVGGLAGPVAYWAGQRLGALHVAEPASTSYLVIAVVWALVLPALTALDRWLPKSAYQAGSR